MLGNAIFLPLFTHTHTTHTFPLFFRQTLYKYINKFMRYFTGKKEFDARISKANKAQERLRNRVINQYIIRLSTKLLRNNPLLSCTDATPAPCTSGTSRNWKISTSELFALYLVSHRSRSSPTLTLWTLPSRPAPNQCSARQKSDGLATSSAWCNLTFSDACCTESFYVAEAIKFDQRNGTKTQLKRTSTGTWSKERS